MSISRVHTIQAIVSRVHTIQRSIYVRNRCGAMPFPARRWFNQFPCSALDYQLLGDASRRHLYSTQGENGILYICESSYIDNSIQTPPPQMELTPGTSMEMRYCTGNPNSAKGLTWRKITIITAPFDKPLEKITEHYWWQKAFQRDYGRGYIAL